MIVFQTERLIIRMVKDDDTDFITELWNEPAVMKYVGFPGGLKITKQQVSHIIKEHDENPYDHILIITLQDGTRIGNTKIGSIKEEGICETDMKIAPQFWGNSYGKETKKGLVDYIFKNTDAQIVQATPNKQNSASIKMQEYVGAKPVKEGIFTFPEDMQDYTCPVPYIIYHLTREEWKKRLE